MKSYNKNISLLCCSLAAMSATNSLYAESNAKSAKKTDKPNIVIVLADDLGWGDLGYHGSDTKTPNLDALAGEAVELKRFYTSPVSTPTRAGLLTGRYPNRFGVRTAVIPPWRKDGLDAEEDTIADMLERNGYDNRAIIGKWHLGHTQKIHYPLSRGFSHFYGFLNGATDHFTHIREGELDWHNDWDSCYDEGYSTDLLTAEAVRCIDEYKEDGPFFLYLAYNAPHTPIQAKEEDIALYTDNFDKLSKNDQRAATYKAMVTCLDRGIGKVIDKLESEGLMENTFFLFFSDNGVPPFAPGASSGEFKGNKFLEWEGGVRSPAILKWGKTREYRNELRDQVCGFVDIMPTIKDLLGDKSKPKREFDGISILPVLEGKKSEIERDFYLGCGSVVNKNFKLVRKDFNHRFTIDRDFLVDLRYDPYEIRNVADEYEKEMQRLTNIAIKYDTITPCLPEVPYEQGSKGFVAPKEWKVKK